MQTKEIIIEVDKITSGKVNIISFYRNGKQIHHAALRLKDKSVHPKSIYNYKHHFDYNDLKNISSKFPQIFTYEEVGGSKSNWSNKMQIQFERLIRANKLYKVIEKKGIKYICMLVWRG
jgi:hypothetical protein